MNETYSIKCPLDFLKVPEDRLDLCLIEFRTWLELHRGVRAIDPTGHVIRPMGESFDWINDDLGNVRVTLTPMATSPQA